MHTPSSNKHSYDKSCASKISPKQANHKSDMGGHGSLNPRHLSQVNSELSAGIRCCSDVSRGDVCDFLGDLLFQAINVKTMRVKMNSSLRKYRLPVNV